MRTFPSVVLELSNVTHINLDNNRLRIIPDLCSLRCLQVLQARDNQLHFVGALPQSLCELMLSDNPISVMPELQHLTSLVLIELMGVRCIPDEYQAEIKGASLVQSHIRQISPVLRARRVASCLLTVRRFRKSELNRLQKDVVKIVVRYLIASKHDTESWWERYNEKER